MLTSTILSAVIYGTLSQTLVASTTCSNSDVDQFLEDDDPAPVVLMQSEIFLHKGKTIPPATEIKLISAGFGRSGSTSVECALMKLGYNPTHGDITFHPENLPAWLDWARGGSFEPALQQVLALGYNATTSDQPTGLAWREFMERFPDAPVLNILHPLGAEGFVEDVAQNNWHGCFTGQQELMSYFIDCCNFKMNFTDSERRELCAREYTQTHEEIQNSVPVERLLSFSATDGWEPLCNFLGIPVLDEPFPHVHGGDLNSCPYALPWETSDLQLVTGWNGDMLESD